MGPMLCDLVKNTLITLISKVEDASQLSQFWPISLCNVYYKILTKLIAQRLKSTMSKLVNLVQYSFVPNRQSRDNVIIVPEVFHSMRKKKGRRGWMVIKLDLEKT